MLRLMIPTLALGIGITALAAAALAQNLPPEANAPAVKAARAACSADIQKFCANVEPGGGRIVRCLVGNASQLSAGCRSSMLSAKTALGR
jgi:Cysteine rich repeat